MQKKLMTILAWNETRARALALVLNLFCVLILASRSHLAVAAPSQIVSMEYLFAEAKVELPSQLDNRDWQPFESQKNALSPRRNESLWLRIKVAHSESDPSPTLSFEKIFVRYKLYKDKQLVSEFGSNSGYPGLPPHLITLPADQGNIFYHMRVQSAATRIGPIGAVKIGHRSDFIVDMLKADAVKLFAVSILGLLGVVGLILFFSYRHVLTYLHLAMFSICGMFYLAAGLKLRSVLGINPVWIGNASYIGLYAAPLFFVEFYKNIFALDSLPKYLKVTRFTSLMFLPISLISAPFLSVGLLSLLPAFYAVSVPLFLAVFMHSFRHRGFVEYKRTFHFGFIFLLAAGLWEAANEVRIINS
ncbi:MAG: hypothetical protein RI953_1719, partial [Pseudomonadota bacterium]